MKYGVIASARLFKRLERQLAAILARDPDVLVPVVAECCRIKARVVSMDEHETGVRRILNFGHTVGHALEAITDYKRFLHGEAVGWGMLAAAEVARARGALAEDTAARLARLVNRLGERPAVDDLSAAECADSTKRDKKVVAGTLHFVLPVALGRTEIVANVRGQSCCARSGRSGCGRDRGIGPNLPRQQPRRHAEQVGGLDRVAVRSTQRFRNLAALDLADHAP